uniref:MFS domain-containing protein n=1 Tax=Bursaphelenchus xylophilus TaxID=6326 RepID=A0A1I7SRT4_BURXY
MSRRPSSESVNSGKFSLNSFADSSTNASDFNETRTEWTSIYSAALLSFISAVQFSLYLSSMWPYMQMLDKEITENFFGLVVSAYSVGQIVAAPLFGWWSNRIKKVSPPLSVGLTMMLLGNAMYIVMAVVPIPNRILLLVGRLITGVGSGNVALLRTYASTASTTDDRSRAIAFVTCGQALGMVVGPVFQLIFTPLGFPGFELFVDKLRFNLYTAPAYLACLMNIAGMGLLRFAFVEKSVGIVTKTCQSADAESQRVEEVEVQLPKYDGCAILVCYATRFTDVFVRTNLETLGAAFAMMMFSMTEHESVAYNPAAQGVVGFLTFATYVFYIYFHLDKQ